MIVNGTQDDANSCQRGQRGQDAQAEQVAMASFHSFGHLFLVAVQALLWLVCFVFLFVNK